MLKELLVANSAQQQAKSGTILGKCNTLERYESSAKEHGGPDSHNAGDHSRTIENFDCSSRITFSKMYKSRVVALGNLKTTTASSYLQKLT